MKLSSFSRICLAIGLLALPLAFACGDDDKPSVDAQADAREKDAAEDAAADAKVNEQNTKPRPRLPLANDINAPRDYRWARGLIHMHSIHSHDACDGEPKDEDGNVNQLCLDRFRAAMCENRFDFVLLTDHPKSFGAIPFDEAFLHAEGDRWLPNEQNPLANYFNCEGDHEVMIAAGSEGDIMPVMFRRQPDITNLRDPNRMKVEALKEDGALVFQMHSEREDFDHLKSLGLDGLEVYNPHATLDSRGPLKQYENAFAKIGEWAKAAQNAPHWDLLHLAILEENHIATKHWDNFLAESQMLGFAGNDVHENVPLGNAPDGDRVDSYRRLTGWVSNWMMLEAEDVTWDAVRNALENRRNLAVFDLLGPPDGFDMHASRGDDIIDMGGEGTFEPGWTLNVSAPKHAAESPIEIIVWRIDGNGQRHEAAKMNDSFSFNIEQAGAYRVEIRQTPTHLSDEFPAEFQQYIRNLPWIYSNAIRFAAQQEDR